jgi:hypothetical protein
MRETESVKRILNCGGQFDAHNLQSAPTVMLDPTHRLVIAVFVQTAFRQVKLARRSLSGLLAHVPPSHIQQCAITDYNSFPVHITDPTTVPNRRKCSLYTVKAL